MVGLQLESLHEIPSEIANWEPKSPLKMSYEDYVLTRTCRRGKFACGKPTFDFQWDPPRVAEPFDVSGGDVRALPGTAGLVDDNLLLWSDGDDAGA
jgi:hypothetical protein